MLQMGRLLSCSFRATQAKSRRQSGGFCGGRPNPKDVLARKPEIYIRHLRLPDFPTLIEHLDNAIMGHSVQLVSAHDGPDCDPAGSGQQRQNRLHRKQRVG